MQALLRSEIYIRNFKENNLMNLILGKTVDIMLASLETTYTRKTLIKAASEHKDHVITSVVPGDFNGDTQMDVLVTWQQKDIKHGPITTEIYWGDSKEIKTG